MSNVTIPGAQEAETALSPIMVSCHPFFLLISVLIHGTALQAVIIHIQKKLFIQHGLYNSMQATRPLPRHTSPMTNAHLTQVRNGFKKSYNLCGSCLQCSVVKHHRSWHRTVEHKRDGTFFKCGVCPLLFPFTFSSNLRNDISGHQSMTFSTKIPIHRSTLTNRCPSTPAF